MEESLRSSLDRISNSCDGVRIKQFGIDGDHIHMVISLKPRTSIAQAIRVIKQQSTNDLYLEHECLLKKYYRKRIVWSDGYFAESIGHVAEEVVIDYVKNQGT